MKVNRSKFVRKYLRFYRLVFAIEAPFKVLLDGNFIFAAFKYKVDIIARLATLLQQDKVEVFVLRSAVQELNGVGEKAADAYQFAVKMCSVLEDMPKGDTGGKGVKGGKGGKGGATKGDGNPIAKGTYAYLRGCKHDPEGVKYFVATQDSSLRTGLGNLGGIPLVYLNKVTMVMEAPSDASRQSSASTESTKTVPTEREAELLAEIKKKEEATVGEAGEAADKERRKRKATCANPLASKLADAESVKTKKKKTDQLKRSRRA